MAADIPVARSRSESVDERNEKRAEDVEDAQNAAPSAGAAVPGAVTIADNGAIREAPESTRPPLDEKTGEWIGRTLERLSHSEFRSKFSLSARDLDYTLEKGPQIIDRHAHELLRKRVGDAFPAKDGKQTPWRGHPVFTAQHATATCCRGCIEKWHHVPKGRELTDAEIDRFSALVMAWVAREVLRAEEKRRNR